ncbi:MAG: hypothetical protein EHM18_11080 [Acidobacteria bacterium]|nr:MAG: hypothetical protein EHM18_11080 [Acidobacteriota bacterium]
MNCDESRELILDVVYGEEVPSRSCFDFFKHLDSCPDCTSEYREFLSTREMLQSWQLEEPSAAESSVKSAARPWMQGRRFLLDSGSWWGMLQKVAAGVLILMGIASIFQHYGYLGGRKVMVSEQQLTEMVHDMIVVSQAQERRVIGQELIRFSEAVDLQRNQDLQDVYNNLVSLEQRYTDNLEENNRYLKALLTK